MSQTLHDLPNFVAAIAVTELSVPGGHTDLKATVSAAAKNLADQPSYQWKTTAHAERREEMDFACRTKGLDEGHAVVPAVIGQQIEIRRDQGTQEVSEVDIHRWSLARQLRECAAKEGVTLDQLLSSAAAEKLSALITVEHLRQRALRAKRADFATFLDGSPDVPPLPGDELE
jgi:acyl transferase domain-containing protein